MTNDKCRKNSKFRNPNKGRNVPAPIRHSDFGLPSSFVIRISSLPSGSNTMTTEATVRAASKKMTNWESLRADFPILHQKVHGHPLIYFDNAATSQKPREVIDAVGNYYERDNANVHRGIHELSNRATAAFEAARARAAEFINARSANEIVFTRGTTEGINLVAQAWGGSNLKSGDKILLTEMEHHSNLVPWQMLAERTGAQLVYVPVSGDEGLLDWSKLDSLLTKEVKL